MLQSTTTRPALPSSQAYFPQGSACQERTGATIATTPRPETHGAYFLAMLTGRTICVLPGFGLFTSIYPVGMFSSACDTHCRPHASGALTLIQPFHVNPRRRPVLLPRHQTAEHSLSKFDKLYEKRKPAIEKVQPWFSGYRIVIDNDGNCYGTSWLVLTLVWAVQCPRRLVYITDRLEAARCRGGAFGGLDDRAQVRRHTGFIFYWVQNVTNHSIFRLLLARSPLLSVLLSYLLSGLWRWWCANPIRGGGGRRRQKCKRAI